MKRFVVKVLLILLPVISFCVVCEVLMRKGDNDYKYKNGWLSNHSSSVRILSLGSSHGYYGIDPTAFSLQAFNAAHVSQDVKYDQFIFNKFIDRMDSLQYLIYPMSYFTMWSDLENGDESWRVKYYCIYYHCHYHPLEIEYHLEIADGFRPPATNDGAVGFGRVRYCTDLGQGTLFRLASRREGWKESGESRAKLHAPGAESLKRCPVNGRMITEIAAKCRERGIRMILVTMPAYLTYYQNLDPDYWDLTHSFCEDLTSRFDNVTYLDYIDDPRFNEDDFYDADHLNEFGAMKFSGILNGYIMEDMAKALDR